MPGGSLRPHAGVRGTQLPSSGSGGQPLAPQGSERTEVRGGLVGRRCTPERTGRVSRKPSVPRQLRGTARARSLSSGSPPGTGRDPSRSPERLSDGFVAVKTKPPGKRRGRGRRRRGGREVRDLYAREGIVLCGLLETKIIHCEVRLVARDVVFEASFVYACNEYSLRTELWNTIGTILDSAGETPSVVLGDFNVIRTIEEKSGGGPAPRGMREFGQCILRAGLEDLRFAGCQFTGPTTDEV
ncbi:hypothetical protein Dimus_030464 [Dionaea muscipula]